MKKIMRVLILIMSIIVLLSSTAIAWDNGYVINNSVPVTFLVTPQYVYDVADFYTVSSYGFSSAFPNIMIQQQSQIVFQGFQSDPSISITTYIANITIDWHRLRISGTSDDKRGVGTTFSGISAVGATDRSSQVLNPSGHQIGISFSVTGQLGCVFYPGESSRDVDFN